MGWGGVGCLRTRRGWSVKQSPLYTEAEASVAHGLACQLTTPILSDNGALCVWECVTKLPLSPWACLYEQSCLVFTPFKPQSGRVIATESLPTINHTHLSSIKFIKLVQNSVAKGGRKCKAEWDPILLLCCTLPFCDKNSRETV